MITWALLLVHDEYSELVPLAEWIHKRPLRSSGDSPLHLLYWSIPYKVHWGTHAPVLYIQPMNCIIQSDIPGIQHNNGILAFFDTADKTCKSIYMEIFFG